MLEKSTELVSPASGKVLVVLSAKNRRPCDGEEVKQAKDDGSRYCPAEGAVGKEWEKNETGEEEESEELLIRIKNAFSSRGEAYGRAREREVLRAFLKSSRRVLHVSGNPGKGKTKTVLEVAGRRDVEYVNYYEQANMFQRLMTSKAKILIIDEFDKFYSENHAKCRKALATLSSRKDQKIITISNTRQFSGLQFSNYTSEDIFWILKRKIEEEVKEKIASDSALRAIAAKYGRDGDMRGVYNEIVSALIAKKDKKVYLELRDIMRKDQEMAPGGIHQELIIEASKDFTTFTQAYKAYLKRCMQHSISPISRKDARSIFEST